MTKSTIARHQATLSQAQAVGLMGDTKNARIAGRVSAKLVAAAKKRVGTTSDTEIIEIALATLALEDDFGAKLVRRKGSVPKKSILSFDIDAALRWLKPHRRLHPLARRKESELSWIDEALAIGTPILLDTTVYIDILQQRSLSALDEFIALRTCCHSSVCLSEMTHAFGRLNPSDPRTASALRAVRQTVSDIPAHRLLAPDAEIWGAAGILAGILFRCGSYATGSERKCLNDALVYLQARKLGCPVVTGNLKDFDCLNQLVPDGRVLFYRRV